MSTFCQAISSEELEQLQEKQSIHCFTKTEFKKFKDQLNVKEIDNYLYCCENEIKMIKLTNITGPRIFANKLVVNDDKITGGFFSVPSKKSSEISKRVEHTAFFHLIGTAGRSEYHMGIAKFVDEYLTRRIINNKEEWVSEFEVVQTYAEYLQNRQETQIPMDMDTPRKRQKQHIGPVAQPTYYNGREYDSKLEAEWAFFFDLASIRHNYPSRYENIKLFNQQRVGEYTPDFHCPGVNCELVKGYKTHAIVEIKPCYPTEAVKCKCESLATQYPGQLVVIIYGMPRIPFQTELRERNGIPEIESYRAISYFYNEETLTITENLIFVKDENRIKLDTQQNTDDMRWKLVEELYQKVIADFSSVSSPIN